MTEGDSVTIQYAILSDLSLVSDIDFATFFLETLPGTATGGSSNAYLTPLLP